MAEELARVLDPSELDALTGSHGRMSTTISASELGSPIAIVVPSRLVCARCDGGGCDSCGRSGAIRLDLSEAERTTHVVLPAEARDAMRIRLVKPVEGLEQLTLEVRLKPETGMVVAARRDLAVRSAPGLDVRSVVIGIAVAVAAALAFALTR